MTLLTIATIIEGAYLDGVITSSQYIALCCNIDTIKTHANMCMSALDYLTIIS